MIHPLFENTLKTKSSVLLYFPWIYSIYYHISPSIPPHYYKYHTI